MMINLDDFLNPERSISKGKVIKDVDYMKFIKNSKLFNYLDKNYGDKLI